MSTPDENTALGDAQVIVPCTDLPASIEFLERSAAFRLLAISPADSPRVAILRGHGLTVRLEVGFRGSPPTLMLPADDALPESDANRELVGPGGLRLRRLPPPSNRSLPTLRPGFIVTRSADSAPWVVGRAGMKYRDLIPGRLGGRFIASHIHIEAAGPVPDYVHFHDVRFQLIYCKKGWVRVVYEDQGEPFTLEAGDAVLQPPKIRHRVLESSGNLEVIEIGCPAEHETAVDHEMTLPTNSVDPARRFQSQHFVRHVKAGAPMAPFRVEGFVCRDLGIEEATNGLAGARVVSPLAAVTETPSLHHSDVEFQFLFVLAGTARLRSPGRRDESLTEGTAVTLPANWPYAFLDVASDFSFLETSLPAQLTAESTP